MKKIKDLLADLGNRHHKDLGKKLMAVVAALVMLGGMAGASTMALADDATGHGNVTNTGMDGNADQTSASYLSMVKVTSPGLSEPKHTKSIEYQGNGKYTLKLDVTGKDASTSTTTTTPIDIVLALDVSGSMRYPFDGYDSGQKLEALKKAVNSFLDETTKTNATIENEADKVAVSLVKYANESVDWIGDDNCRGGNCTQIVRGLTTNTDSLKNNVNRLWASGATYADAAMTVAERALSAGTRANAKKYVIFFTDGEPNHYNGFEGSVANAAIAKSKELKNAGTTVYSIGVFNGANPSEDVAYTSNTNRFMHGISSNYPNATGYRNLGTRASGDYYYAASNSAQLKRIFDDIQKTITEKHVYTGVSITDRLSGYTGQSGIVYDESAARIFDGKTFYKVTGGVTLNATGGAAGETPPVADTDYTLWYSEDGNGVVRAEFAESYELKNDMTYTLSYDVEPTDFAYQTYAKTGYDATGDADTGATSAGKAGFRSNETAQVCYTTDDRSNCVDYQHPVLQVPVANVTVTKEWPDAQPADGTEVRMHLKGYDDAVDHTVTLNADNHWSDSFVKLAPGEYTLSEEAIDGYTKVGDEKVTVTISKDELWALADKDADLQQPLKTYEFTIQNQRNTVALQDGVKISKTTQGNDYAESFDFELTDITSDAQKMQNTGSILKGLDGGKQTTSIGNLNADIAKNGAFTADAKGNPLTFSTPLNDGTDTYTFNVMEIQPAARHGWRFDRSEYHVTVTVAKNASGQYEAKVTQVVQVKDRDGQDIATDKQQPVADLTSAFVNRYISVATLPATGGLTGRQWLFIGGCLGLIAIVAGVIVSIWSNKKRLY